MVQSVVVTLVSLTRYFDCSITLGCLNFYRIEIYKIEKKYIKFCFKKCSKSKYVRLLEMLVSKTNYE